MADMRLMHGDCLERMKEIADGSVDMVLTDPPYGMGFQSNHRQTKHNKIAGDNCLEWLDDFAAEAFRVAKDDTAHYVFTSFHHIDKFKQAFERFFAVKNILVWEKNNTSMGDLTGDFAPKVEFVLLLAKGRREIIGKRDPNIFRFARTDNSLHPTQKPVDLISYLISKFSSIGEMVFDPFMGSGTTGVSCANMGRDFIGIELDKSYFDIAKRRIEESNKRLF